MTRTTSLSAIGFAVASIFLFAGGAAFAEDAMKPATDSMAKAGMETDAMKKDEAMKACDDMAMKGDAMSTDAMKPASSN